MSKMFKSFFCVFLCFGFVRGANYLSLCLRLHPSVKDTKLCQPLFTSNSPITNTSGNTEKFWLLHCFTDNESGAKKDCEIFHVEQNDGGSFDTALLASKFRHGQQKNVSSKTNVISKRFYTCCDKSESCGVDDQSVNSFANRLTTFLERYKINVTPNEFGFFASYPRPQRRVKLFQKTYEFNCEDQNTTTVLETPILIRKPMLLSMNKKKRGPDCCYNFFRGNITCKDLCVKSYNESLNSAEETLFDTCHNYEHFQCCRWQNCTLDDCTERIERIENLTGRKLAEDIMLGLSSFSIFVTAIILLIWWLLNDGVVLYPHKTIMYIVLCYFFYSIGCLSQFILTKWKIGCSQLLFYNLNQSFVQDSYFKWNCYVISPVLYYFDLAGSFLWLWMTVACFLEAKFYWGREAKKWKRLTVSFHVFCWLIPIIIIAFVAVLQFFVDKSSTTGLCHFGRENFTSYLIAIGCICCLGFGFHVYSIWKIRSIRFKLRKSLSSSSQPEILRQLDNHYDEMTSYALFWCLWLIFTLVLFVFGFVGRDFFAADLWDVFVRVCDQPKYTVLNDCLRNSPTLSELLYQGVKLFCGIVISTVWLCTHRKLLLRIFCRPKMNVRERGINVPLLKL